jgi:hypothetical protein
VDTAEAGHGSVSINLGLYNQLDKGDGNPFLDEELTVIEPVVIVDYGVTDRLGSTVTLTYDHITSASIDRIDGRSKRWGGADDTYAGGDVALRYQATGQVLVGGHLGYSVESDYRSLAFGGNVSLGRVDQDATVSLQLDGFSDRVDINRFDGSDEGTERRSTGSATVTWYQVFTPRVHGEFGVTGTAQAGFLETPYNSVVLEDAALPPNPDLDNRARGVEIPEQLPDRRYRGALFGRVRRWMRTGTALELGGRVYADTWGIGSASVEPRWYQNLWSPDLTMRLRYRYYAQSAARDYGDRFTRVTEFRTQDSDLADFTSHTVGGKLTWEASRAHRFSLGGDYVARSDGLNQTFFDLGWTWSF